MFMQYHFNADRVSEGLRVLWKGLSNLRQKRHHEIARRQLAIRVNQMSGYPVN